MKKKTKKVKAIKETGWAVVAMYMPTPKLCASLETYEATQTLIYSIYKHERDAIKNAKKSLLKVVPCTITYSIKK